jgi:outer membrane protein insertion porin family
MYLTYKFDDTIIRDVINEDDLLQTRTRAELNEELGEGILSSVRLQLVRDLRNNRFEPTSGDFESFSIEYAGVGGDKKFVKGETDFRFYKELTEGGWVFRSRIKMGVLGQTQDRLIPVNERFFLGGPQSLKGYSDFTVSPFEGFRPTGGLYQAFSNIEFEHPLIREAGIKGVLFYDIGNVWVESPFASGADRTFLSDYGFGIRWFSPVGVLRFEFGYPIKKRTDPIVDKSPFFSFMIGPPF